MEFQCAQLKFLKNCVHWNSVGESSIFVKRTDGWTGLLLCIYSGPSKFFRALSLPAVDYWPWHTAEPLITNSVNMRETTKPFP